MWSHTKGERWAQSGLTRPTSGLARFQVNAEPHRPAVRGPAPSWKDRVARLQRDGRLSQPEVGLYPRPRCRHKLCGVADDDWRVCITFKDEAHVRRTAELLRERQVTDDARRRLGNRIVVSEDRGELFLYAGSENAAREAEQLVGDVLAQHQMDADVTLSRWHPGEERWEDAGVPLPETAEQRHTEHERLIADETKDSLACGYGLWEVRCDLPTHREAVELAANLKAEGYQVTRRWKFLSLFADNEDAVNDLAKAVRRDAPANAAIQTEEGVFVNGVAPLFPD